MKKKIKPKFHKKYKKINNKKKLSKNLYNNKIKIKNKL